MSMQLGLGIHLGKVLPAGGPFAGAIPLTTADVLTAQRVGGRASFFSGRPDVPADTADIATANGLSFASSFKGETNLVSTDLTTWSEGGVMGVWTATPGALGYTVAYSGGGASVLRGVFALSSTTRTLRCQMRLIAGTPPSSGNVYIALRESGTPREQYNLSDLTSDWTTITLTTNGTDATNELTFRGDGAAWTVEIRHIAVTDTNYPTLATPNNSASSASYGTDSLVNSAINWGDGRGVITSCVIPGWSPAAQGPDSNPRFWNINGQQTRVEYSQSASQLRGGAGSDTASLAAAWDEVSPFVASHELDGANITLTRDDGTTGSVASTEVFSGDFRVGAETSASQTINGAVCAHYWPGGLPVGVTFADLRAAYHAAALAVMGGQ